jgi:ubiquinol-cytochrome c reductase iron-sulfur subunit
VSKARDALIAGAVLLLRRRKPRPLGPGERERVVPLAPQNAGSELTAALLLLAGAGCAIAFVVVYVLDRLPAHTQLLGLSLGLACLFIAAALIVTAHRLIVTEELEEDYPAAEHPEEQELVVQVVQESFTRRRLLKVSLLVAGGALGAAILTPIASLGPAIDVVRFYTTPWRRGARLVDEHGRPYRATDIEEDNFYTAFAEGSDKESLASSLVLVRLPKSSFHLPFELAHYPADGIVAYSKICTHAGCAISLYRAPLFQADEPTPALVCPCHYSTFNPADGGSVEFGPAGRKLPMLPLLIAPNGELRAAGNFDGPVGPSWWGVRDRKPRT